MVASNKIVREGYKMTDVGEIPIDWGISNVGQIANINTGKKDTKDKIDHGIYPFFVRSQTVENINSFSYDGEAVLTAGDGVGVGKVFHYINGKFDYHQRVYKISDFRNVYGRYFYYYFQKYFLKQVRKFNAKTSVDSVRMEMISKMLVPIPPMEEQQKIAEILSTVDDQIGNTEQLIEKTKELKKGLMQQLLTKGIGHTEFKQTELGEIPVEWEVQILEKLVEKITDGAHKTPKYKESGIPFLRVTDIQQKEINWENTKYISQEEHLELIKRCNPEPGDLLLSKNGTIGLVKIIDWEREFSIFVSLCLIKVKKENSLLDSKFLSYYVSSDTAQKQFKDSSKQGTVTNLHLVEIKKSLVPIPTIKEQQKIASILSTVDEQIESYEQEKEKYLELKKGLMQQLLTGKIRVTV